jgi:hypothetical protein
MEGPMASQKQLLANKLNAKKSTGAKTPEGKRRSSLNAIKHGLTCEKHVAIGENKREFELLKLRVLRDFPVFDVKSEIYVRKIIQYEWSLRRYQLIETGIFSRESLDYNQSENITRKDYYLDSAELTSQHQKVLVRQVELPSVAFLRDSNAGNAFLKINTIDGRLFSRLRLAIQEYEIHVKSKGGKNHEKKLG